MPDNFERFGKFTLLHKLNAGGMAEVYLAKSSGADGVGKFVAIKRILPQHSSHPEFIEMFKDEAKLAVNLKHRNLVSITDFGFENKQFFLVMEYVEGKNLREIINEIQKQGKRFSIPQAVYIIKEGLAGLDYAHRSIDPSTGNRLNIIHRDISPQNIMINYEGEIKIVDFGIAKAELGIETATKSGVLKGKFGYMSPEQAEAGSIDQRTDIFSAGIVLWELLARDRLFAAKNEINALKKIQECHIPDLRKINPQIQPELERIVRKALSKDRVNRYETASDFYKDLNKFLNTTYPEFTSVELSEFLHDVFSNEITELREKMKAYSQIVSDTPIESGKTALTTTKHKIPQIPNQIPNLDANQGPNQIQNQTNQTHQSGNSPNAKDSDAYTKSRATRGSNSHIRSSGTKQARRASEFSIHNPTNWIYLGAILLVIAGFFNKFRDRIFDSSSKKPSVAPQVLQGTGSTNFASAGRSVVHVQSNPQGAQIFLDGKYSGFITPGRITVVTNAKINLSLKKQGYGDLTRTLIGGQDSDLFLTLLPAVTKNAYLDIRAINGGASPVVYVNNVRLAEKPPIVNYGVPSGTKIQVRIENPLNKMYGIWEGEVRQEQRKPITVIVDKSLKAH